MRGDWGVSASYTNIVGLKIDVRKKATNIATLYPLR